MAKVASRQVDSSRRLPARLSDTQTRDYIVAMLAAAAAILLRWGLNPVLHDDHAFVLPLTAVVLVAWSSGFGPALVALLLGVAGTTYLVVPPHFSFRIDGASNQLGVVLVLLCGVVIALLGEAQRTARRRVGRGLAELRTAHQEAIDSERKSRASEARKAAIIDAALDCVITIDHAGRVVEFNPAAERTFGYRREEVIGREMAELIVPPAHRAAHRRGLAHYLVTGDGPVLNRRLELPALRRDGTEFPAELSVTAIPTGGPPLFTGYLRDVSDRQRAVAALAESEARFRLLTENIPQIVWHADAAGRPTYFNTRWRDYTGVELEDLGPDGWLSPLHPDDAGRVAAAWRATVEQRADRFAHEFRLRRAADGAYRWFLSVAVPLRRADGTIDQWVGSLADIDDQKREAERLEEMVRDRTAALSRTNAALQSEVGERRRAETRERAAAAELRRSNEELEKFAYVASHDLQEPLRKIQAFGDRLAKRSRDQLGDQGRESLDRILDSAGRMRRLIDDLLTYSRVALKAQPFAPVDLNAVLADVTTDLELRITQTDARLEIAPLPTIDADPTQMRQLFQNLIGNALKFQTPGVPPVVQVSAAGWDSLPPGADPPPPAGAGWRITVTDNGIGFDQQYADRVFEVFQRLHGRGQYEGTGIGLAICRKIVDRHGGTIAARSRPGEGATFVVDLPAGAAHPGGTVTA